MSSESEVKIRAFLSRRTVFEDTIEPAILIVKNGKIIDIIRGAGNDNVTHAKTTYPDLELDDLGDLVLMPGFVDSHVHVNEPGRTEWEGFYTATRAAAAGGVTTIADMPLNSIPPTTTVENLKVKAKEARRKIFVDVAFWGGVIPGNQNELKKMVDAGVVGFKCFLCPSGVEEFPHVDEADVVKALSELKSTNSVLAFHAECDDNKTPSTREGDPMCYETFLKSRPSSMEKNAIEKICHWCKTHDVRCHIVHLSASEALNLIKITKDSGARLTVETCYHYLILTAEDVPKNATEFKCCPPIRDKANQEKLWSGLKDGILDMIVSDHSPCIKELKASGNFLTAWGGISSLQFGLPLIWTAAQTRGIGLTDLSRLLSAAPAKLCGLNNRKGSLSVGMDADFAIWDPEEEFKVEPTDILYKNKVTPYKDRILHGKIISTVLGGKYIYKHGQLVEQPSGQLLLKNCTLD